jgi:hypothetical protein
MHATAPVLCHDRAQWDRALELSIGNEAYVMGTLYHEKRGPFCVVDDVAYWLRAQRGANGLLLMCPLVGSDGAVLARLGADDTVASVAYLWFHGNRPALVWFACPAFALASLGPEVALEARTKINSAAAAARA